MANTHKDKYSDKHQRSKINDQRPSPPLLTPMPLFSQLPSRFFGAIEAPGAARGVSIPRRLQRLEIKDWRSITTRGISDFIGDKSRRF